MLFLKTNNEIINYVMWMMIYENIKVRLYFATSEHVYNLSQHEKGQ